MAEGWTSDWEKLFAKCVADPDYRARLATALEKIHLAAKQIPLDVNPAMARLFLSNVRLALAIWRHRQKQALEPR